MKIKKDLDICTQDFWYDLTDGGYLKPEEILVNQEDIDKVNKSIEILMEFQQSCEDEIEGFVQ